MPESVQGRCCSLDDVYDARRVAETSAFRIMWSITKSASSAMWCARSWRSISQAALRSRAVSATII